MCKGKNSSFQNSILSVAMMFRYSLNLAHEAKIVEDAVRATIDGG